VKTIKISDEAHRKLTATLGKLMAQTGKMQTYQDAIVVMLTRSIKLPKEILIEVENFIRENKHLGYITKEDFIKEAVRFKLKLLKGEGEYIEIPKEKCEKLNEVIKSIKGSCHDVAGFINGQIEEILDQYERWIREKANLSFQEENKL